MRGRVERLPIQHKVKPSAVLMVSRPIPKYSTTFHDLIDLL